MRGNRVINGDQQMTAIFGVDYTTISFVVGAFILPAIAGTRWYLTLRSKKGAIQADVHAFRLAVDDIDNAVQAGTLPSADAALKIWEDLLTIKKATKEVVAPAAPAPAPAPTPPAA